MKNAFFTVVCLMSIFMLASCSLFAPAPFPIDIHVVDEHGKPIPHAIVKKSQMLLCPYSTYVSLSCLLFYPLSRIDAPDELGITDKNGYIRYEIDVSKRDWRLMACLPSMINYSIADTEDMLKDPQYLQELEKNKKLDITITIENANREQEDINAYNSDAYFALFKDYSLAIKSPEFLKQEQTLKQRYFKIMEDVCYSPRSYMMRLNERDHVFTQEEIDAWIPPETK